MLESFHQVGKLLAQRHKVNNLVNRKLTHRELPLINKPRGPFLESPDN